MGPDGGVPVGPDRGRGRGEFLAYTYTRREAALLGRAALRAEAAFGGQMREGERLGRSTVGTPTARLVAAELARLAVGKD